MTESRQSPLERYLSILEIVAASDRSLSLTELSNLIGLPKPTVHRLVGVLQKSGALQADEGPQRMFRIGPRMWKILHMGQDQRVVTNYAQIVCDKLATQIKETCYIVKLGVGSVHAIARSVPNQGYRLHVLPGKELPAHAASSAKAIIAHQDNNTVRRLLQEPLEKLTEQTKTDMHNVQAELAQIRKQGYAVCDREIDANIMAYSCPVFMQNGDVIYSLGVTGPCSRLLLQPAQVWVDALQASALQFAAMLSNFDED